MSRVAFLAIRIRLMLFAQSFLSLQQHVTTGTAICRSQPQRVRLPLLAAGTGPQVSSSALHRAMKGAISP